MLFVKTNQSSDGITDKGEAVLRLRDFGTGNCAQTRAGFSVLFLSRLGHTQDLSAVTPAVTPMKKPSG
jgi:hypothetical protein